MSEGWPVLWEAGPIVRARRAFAQGTPSLPEGMAYEPSTGKEEGSRRSPPRRHPVPRRGQDVAVGYVAVDVPPVEGRGAGRRIGRA